MAEATLTREEFFTKIKNKQHLILGEGSLDKKIENFDFMVMQLLTRYIEPKDLAISLRGLSERGIKQFLDNISKRSAELIMSDCLALENIGESNIIEAQHKILHRINGLIKEEKI